VNVSEVIEAEKLKQIIYKIETIEQERLESSDLLKDSCRFLKTAQNCLPKMLSCNEWPGMSGL